MDRGLWRRCSRVVDGLEVPTPFDLGRFLALLGDRRGRAVELVAVDTSAVSTCGALVVTDRADYICFPAATTPLHQRHIVFHEVAHLVSGDVDGTGLDVRPLAGLIPSLSGELVGRVLGRSHYDDPTEMRAEVVATLLAQRAGAAPVRVVGTTDVDAGLARLVAVLEGRTDEVRAH